MKHEKRILERRLMRCWAYKYFMLVQTYCLHYTAATADEPGLPLRKRTDFEEILIVLR